MRRITVNTSEKYDILLGENLIESVDTLIAPFCPSKKVLIITDDIVDSLYGNEVAKKLQEGGFDSRKFVFINGEPSKNITVLSEILEFAAQSGMRRNDLFLALGGGVVGDMAGLASALYMRGVSLIQMPTTLLSAVDSSIGGKTAIDLDAGKNLCGTFKQPNLVIIDTNIIKELPDDIFDCGMGEVVKCGVIKDLPIFDFIFACSVKENLEKIIFDCLYLKKEIVEQDEFDTKGIRNFLNAGHTIAHSIELLSGYTVMHGNAVAMGLYTEADISEKLGICDKDTSGRIKDTIKKAGLYFDIPYAPKDIANACLLDKKNKDSRIVFLLPEKNGKCREVKLSADELSRLL